LKRFLPRRTRRTRGRAGTLSEAFNDAELKRRLSKGGAECVKSPVYDWENIAETYGGLYALCVKNYRESQAPLK